MTQAPAPVRPAQMWKEELTHDEETTIRPRALFATSINLGAGNGPSVRYDVSPDGQRFLMNVLPMDAVRAAQAPPLTPVLNWTAALRK